MWGRAPLSGVLCSGGGGGLAAGRQQEASMQDTGWEAGRWELSPFLGLAST